MRKLFFLLALSAIGLLMVPIFLSTAQISKHLSKQHFNNGDIIFQSSNCRQCEAVKLATHSDISHCGILFEEKGQWYVLEAVEPVQVVTLSSWIARGDGKHYSIKRLKKEFNQLNDQKIKEMKAFGKKLVGKHYDIYFNWDNDQIYCSELVWKIYNEAANIEICTLKKLKDFDLNKPLVKQMMKERYGNKIPFEESMIAPSDLFKSAKLELVDKQ
jgi:hypothetical protein